MKEQERSCKASALKSDLYSFISEVYVPVTSEIAIMSKMIDGGTSGLEADMNMILALYAKAEAADENERIVVGDDQIFAMAEIADRWVENIDIYPTIRWLTSIASN